jgi:hypothetical protein
MRTISIFSALLAIGFLLPTSETMADIYDEQIRALENQVSDCINRHGRSQCEAFRKQNLKTIEELFRQKQLQGYGNKYKYGAGSGSGDSSHSYQPKHGWCPNGSVRHDHGPLDPELYCDGPH